MPNIKDFFAKKPSAPSSEFCGADPRGYIPPIIWGNLPPSPNILTSNIVNKFSVTFLEKCSDIAKNSVISGSLVTFFPITQHIVIDN